MEEDTNKILYGEKFISVADLELDVQLDTRGIALEKGVYCAYCMTTMTRIEQDKYRCPHCHIVFNDLIV